MLSCLCVKQNKVIIYSTLVLVKSSLNTQEAKGKQKCSHRMLSPKGKGSEEEFLLDQDVNGNKQIVHGFSNCM